MPPLVACPQCESHARIDEDTCPHCGATLRDGAGRFRRTATAAVLGLAATVSCNKPPPIEPPVAEYGPPPTAAAPADAPTAEPTTTPSASATTTATPPVGGEPVDEYGPPPTVD